MKKKDLSGYAVTVGTLEIQGELVGAAVSKIATDSTTAQQVASTVSASYNRLISDLVADGKISSIEKPELKQRWAEIQLEYAVVKANAESVNLLTTNYTAEYDLLDDYLNTTLAVFEDMATSTTVNSTTFALKFSNYYTQRDLLLQSTLGASMENAAILAPKYIGAYPFASLPTDGVNKGDTALAYSLTVGECGFYYYDADTTPPWTRLDAPSTQQISVAWPDVCRAIKTEAAGGFIGGPYPASPDNTISNYIGSGINYSEILGADIALINKMFANSIELPVGGEIKSGYTGGVPDVEGKGFLIGQDGIDIGGGTFRGTLRTRNLLEQAGLTGANITVPTATYWPGSDLVTHCAGLSNGLKAATGTFESKTVQNIVKGGADNSVAYQASDAEVITAASALSESVYTTIKTITAGLSGKVNLYFDGKDDGTSSFYYRYKWVIKDNGVQIASGLIHTNSYQTEIGIAGYDLLAGHTLTLQIKKSIYASTTNVYLKNFRVTPALNTIGVYYSDATYRIIDNATYYNIAGNIDETDTLADFITADHDIYWLGADYIANWSAVRIYTDQAISGNFTGSSGSPKATALAYLAGSSSLRIDYSDTTSDTILSTGYYPYSGTIALPDQDDVVLIGDNRHYGLRQREWVGGEALDVVNKDPADIAHTILAIIGREKSDGTHEATLAQQIDITSGISWIHDVSLHDYAGAMAIVDVLSNFTNTTTGDWKWVRNLTSGGLVETMLMRLYGATGKLWTLGGLITDGTEGARTAGEYIFAETALSIAITSTSYAKKLEYKIKKSGVIRVYFTITSIVPAGSFSNTVYGKIYLNGSAVGTERSATATSDSGSAASATWTGYEDITVASGNLIQVYAKESNTSQGSGSASNMRLGTAEEGFTVGYGG